MLFIYLFLEAYFPHSIRLFHPKIQKCVPRKTDINLQLQEKSLNDKKKLLFLFCGENINRDVNSFVFKDNSGMILWRKKWQNC